MKICLFSRRCPYQMAGGIETYLLYLTQYLTKWGHEVILAYPSVSFNKVAKSMTWAMLKILRIDASEICDSFQLASDVSKIDADIYHGQAQHAFGFSTMRRIGRGSRRPFICTAHGSAWGLIQNCPWLAVQNKVLTLNMERAAFNASDKVICVSNATRCEIMKGYGVKPDRTRVISNGVDPKKYLVKSLTKRKLHGSPDQFVITFFAKGGVRKGVQTSIRILEGLCKEFSPKDEIMVQAIVDRNSFAYFSSICLPRGWALYEDPAESLMLKLLSASDIFIFPTPYEGHSFALLEAMAARNVVLTSSIQPNIETVEDGVSGFTLDPVDSNAWVRCISNLYTDKKSTRRIQENALRRVGERFLAEVMCKKTLELYESAV